LGALYPSKSGLMNKHIVKHIVKPSQSGLMNKHIVKHIVKTYRDKSLKGQCFIFGALCPSKSGLTHKHIAKHIVMPVPVQPYCEESVKYQGHLICRSTDRSNNHAMHLECHQECPISNPQPFPFRTFYLPGYVYRYDMFVYKPGLAASRSSPSARVVTSQESHDLFYKKLSRLTTSTLPLPEPAREEPRPRQEELRPRRTVARISSGPPKSCRFYAWSRYFGFRV